MVGAGLWGGGRRWFCKAAGAGQAPVLAQATDYYPFGKSFENNDVPKNRYLYNGKEFQEQVIGGTQFGWYDYGARFYDPEIGRWHSMDPLAELFDNITPFAYVGNNPIIRTDPFGMDWYTDKDGNYHYDKRLTKSNSAQFFEDNNIEGAQYFGVSGTYTVYTKSGSEDNLTIEINSRHSLNADGSVTDMQTGKKLDAGSSFESKTGKTITAIDDKPSTFDYKNGETFKSNDGNNYQLHNNEWIKLNGTMGNVDAFRVCPGLGYVQLIGVSANYQDAAIIKANGLKTLNDATQLTEQLVTFGGELLLTRKLSLPNPKMVSFISAINMYRGAIKQIKDNQYHDNQVDKSRLNRK